jgi:uncharacterized membrane protein
MLANVSQLASSERWREHCCASRAVFVPVFMAAEAKMKSKAAIGNHPIHPILVPIPIGAFALTLIGDVAHALTQSTFWYQLAHVCMGVGIVTALLAAVFGLIDYLGVKMGSKAKQLATIHLVMNVTLVLVYALNFYLRMNDAALQTSRWPLVFILEVASFLALGVSGWIGGTMSYEHRVGVVEPVDVAGRDALRPEARP